MSDALARLRERFDDPLLVRGREGMQPTPRAQELAPRIHEVVVKMRAYGQRRRVRPGELRVALSRRDLGLHAVPAHAASR